MICSQYSNEWTVCYGFLGKQVFLISFSEMSSVVGLFRLKISCDSYYENVSCQSLKIPKLGNFRKVFIFVRYFMFPKIYVSRTKTHAGYKLGWPN